MKKLYNLKRLAAYCIDWFISLLIYSFFSLLYYSILTQSKDINIDFQKLNHYESWIILLLGYAIYIFYFVYFPYHHQNQTLGKRIVHLKIISTQQNTLSYKRYMLRLLTVFLLEGFIFYPTFLTIQYIECFISEVLAGVLYKISMLLTVLSIFVGILTKQMFHDYLASTKVTNSL